MTIKWTEKDVLEHAEQLKSPFEQQVNPPKVNPRDVLNKILAKGQTPQKDIVK
uniref:Uncharacterized protein n=1 Tax=viral metagenome TaxID=1070528 RepID=A0A6H1ZHJ5_9ZZZZ